MEHIDWIVSFTIFIFVILGVITAIPNFLPDITTQEEIKTSKILYSSLVQEISTNKISVDENTGVYTFVLPEEIGRGNTNYLLEDDFVYGSFKNQATFYKFDAEKTETKTLLYKEDFLDINNLKIFNVTSGEMISFNGQGYVLRETILESKINHSNFYAEYIFEPVDLNIYFNYENENSYSFCGINNNKFYLYDRNLSGNYLIEEVDVNFSSNFWINLIFKSNYKGEVFCKINEHVLDNNFQTSINPGKIIINNLDEHYANSFRIYSDNYLRKENGFIETYFYDANIIDTETVSLNVYNDSRELFGKLDINFNQAINNDTVTYNFPAIIKNAIDQHKLVLFANTKEFILINENQDFNLSFQEDLKLDYYQYEIPEDVNVNIWTKVNLPEDDIKYIYLYKTEGYQTNTDFNKVHDPETHPGITINEISTNKYKIEIDNTGKAAQTDYEVKIPADLTTISIGDSVLITDVDYNLEEAIVLVNKNKNKFLQLYFFDIENKKKECFVDILENNFSINCPEKTFIKARIEDTIKEYPEIKINNSLEKIITYEKIQDFSLDNDFYIKLYNEKENVELSSQRFFGNFSLFERISKYLNEKGEEEIVKVLIKPN